MPTRTMKEQLEYKKEYYENNKDKISDKRREYYEKNKEKLKESKKEYNEKNKDKIKEYQKEYRDNNKDKINKKMTCECGGKYTHEHKSHHMKTKKHQKYLNNINGYSDNSV